MSTIHFRPSLFLICITFIREQKINEMYQIERREHEEYRENIEQKLHKCEYATQKIIIYKKDIEQLKQDIEDYQRKVSRAFLPTCAALAISHFIGRDYQHNLR